MKIQLIALLVAVSYGGLAQNTPDYPPVDQPVEALSSAMGSLGISPVSLSTPLVNSMDPSPESTHAATLVPNEAAPNRQAQKLIVRQSQLLKKERRKNSHVDRIRDSMRPQLMAWEEEKEVARYTANEFTYLQNRNDNTIRKAEIAYRQRQQDLKKINHSVVPLFILFIVLIGYKVIQTNNKSINRPV